MVNFKIEDHILRLDIQSICKVFVSWQSANFPRDIANYILTQNIQDQSHGHVQH